MELTDKEKGKIKTNLDAYLSHFAPVRIEKVPHSKSFCVYQENDEEYTQYCENIDYLNGWLYGCVQTKCKRIREKDKIIAK